MRTEEHKNRSENLEFKKGKNFEIIKKLLLVFLKIPSCFDNADKNGFLHSTFTEIVIIFISDCLILLSWLTLFAY